MLCELLNLWKMCLLRISVISLCALGSFAIYNPNDIEQTAKPYTTGIKIKTSHYKQLSEPYYHSNYSKVYVHNKNYTSSFLNEGKTSGRSDHQDTQTHPVYISEQKAKKINNVLSEHNTNIVDKDTLNSRVVYKRKIDKARDIEVFNRCPKGATGQFVYDASCNQYLDCWNGRGGPRNCAPGTLFNPKTLECDFPEKVECLSLSAVNFAAQQKSAKIETYRQAQCPDDFTGLIPNYSDCSKFFQCNDGQQTPRDCPPGTLFDTNLNICNHAKETTCFSGQSPSSSQIKEEYGGSTDVFGQQYSSQSSRDSRLYSNQQLGNDAPKQGTVYIQYVMCNPSQENCASFQQGTFLLGPGGALCDPSKQQCGQGTRYVPSSSSQSRSHQQAGTYYIKYVMCNTLQEDCAPYQKGIIEASYGSSGQPCNPQHEACGSASQGHSGVKNENLGGQFEGQYHYQEQSRTNYHGSGGQQNGQSGGQYYNRNQFSTNYGFGDGGTYRTSPKPNYNKICSPGDQGCYNRTPASASKPKCPDGFQGITKHPTDCKKFLNCANGITFVQDCAPGTLFNPILSICDFPYNVDCKSEDAEATTLEYDSYSNEGSQFGGPQGCRNGHCNVQPATSSYKQQDCQGGLCNQHGQTATNYNQPGCQGSHCRQQTAGGINYNPSGYSTGYNQGLPSNAYPASYNQAGGYASSSNQRGCPSGQCNNQKQQSSTSYNQYGCQGGECDQQSGSHGNTDRQDHIRCQGRGCGQQGQEQDFGDESRVVVITSPRPPYDHDSVQFSYGKWATVKPSAETGQVQTNEDETEFNGASTVRTFAGFATTPSIATTHHIMKIPPKSEDHLRVEPIDKSNRATSGGLNNEKSSDYTDIFDPNESRNIAYGSSTPRYQKQQSWAPKYPDTLATDIDADYVFEYEDGEPVTLAPENVQVEKKKKTRCDDSDFRCDKHSCVAKNFVCDNVRDCSDGRDEKYCQRHLDEFKAYKNSRLDVLEKQRWDNVTYSTCALLCTDSRKFECKSFNYRKVDRACFLTGENIGTSGALKSYYPCDYYERKSTSLDCSDMHKCPSGKCLNSDQICDGYDDCGDRADEKWCRPEDFGYSVKLAGGRHVHEGRVEVTVFKKTGFICDDQFEITDANVLCKELGFPLGALEVKGNSYFAKDLKENHTLYMMDDIECLGNETSMMQCSFAGWGIHNCADGEIAGVVCRTPEESCRPDYWKCDTGDECVRMPFVCDGLDDCSDNSDEASHHCDAPTALRLVNGSNPREGRLEVRHFGIWGSICDDDFNEDAAKIVCSTLGYSGAAIVKKEAYFGQSSGPIWLDQVSCKGNESDLEKCTHWDWGESNCDHSEDVGVICGGSGIYIEAKRKNSDRMVGYDKGIRNLDNRGTSSPPVSCGYTKDNIFLQSSDVHFRVVRGSVANPGDYPWQAALRINGQGKSSHWCGAVVIASRWVLTAAHCLEGYPKGAFVVVAGEYNVDEDEGTEQQAFVEEYYLHENFRKGHKMGNDIAMILLKGNGFKLNQDIQPICLPDETTDYERSLNCTISGFGTVETGKSAYSHKLRAAWIPVHKIDVCKMAHIYGENIAEGMICAGDLTGGVDACDGDSGGPLACLDDGVFTLYGLTSWGQRCGYANKPGVYVKVSHYKKWVDNIMKVHS